MRQNQRGVALPMIIAGVAILFIVIGAVAVLSFIDKTTTHPASPQPTASPRAKSLTRTSNPASSPKPQRSALSQDEKSYQNDHYSISYPATWFIKTTPMENGGTLEIFSANPLSTTPIFPSLVIQRMPQDQTPTNTGQYFMNQGLIAKNITIDGVSAKEYKGQLGDASQALQETAIVVNHGQDVYLLKYDYQGAQLPSQEQVLTNLITSFKFQ